MVANDRSNSCLVCGVEVLPGASARGSLCAACSGKSAAAAIEEIALTTTLTDPVRIAEIMMSLPGLPMIGCEHTCIASGAIMAALRNSAYGKGGNDDVREALKRTAKQTVDGSCSLTGMCGIAPAIGACFSIFLGAGPGADREQRIAMEAVVRVSQTAAQLTGPGCCKAYVRAGISIAVDMFSEKFGVVLPVQRETIVCKHSESHPHGCREEKCPYFRRPSKDIFASGGFIPGITGCVT